MVDPSRGSIFVEQGSKIRGRKREREKERLPIAFNASPLIYVRSATSKIFQALVKELARIYYSWSERRVLGSRSLLGVWARTKGWVRSMYY